MKRILVTGATGNVGRHVVSQLLASSCCVRALTRNPEAANLPPGIEAVRGDLTGGEALDACLEGVDAVFLVWTATADAAPDAIGRIARHAQRIVLLTSPHKTAHPLFQQPNPVRGLHTELERLIRSSRLRWTVLRPGMMASNALLWWAPQIRAGDVVRWPYAAVPTAPIHEGDIAAVAVRALLEPGHDAAEYVLTGPESLSHIQQVNTIGDVTGRSLRYDEMTREQAERELDFPPVILTMLLDAWSAALGEPAFVTSTVNDVTGMPPRTFRDWVVEHAAAFSRVASPSPPPRV
jgi:uncharacterized protein YbjT (DUF2867 family)